MNKHNAQHFASSTSVSVFCVSVPPFQPKIAT